MLAALAIIFLAALFIGDKAWRNQQRREIIRKRIEKMVDNQGVSC